jgi:hypothetical protein
MDILEDLHARLVAIGFSDPKIEKVVMDIRTDWRGERPYIGVRYEAERRMSARNRAIIRAFKDGESAPLIARRFGISRARVWQIIKG